MRNTACPGSVRQIDVVSVSPGNTGEVNRAADRADLGGVAAAELGDQRAPGDPVGAQPVQDRLREAGQLAREPRIAVQRVAVAGQPVDQRLVLAGGQRDLRVGFAVGDLGRRRPLPRLAAEAALAADDRGRERLGDDSPVSGSVPVALSITIAFLPSPLSWMSATSATTLSLPAGGSGANSRISWDPCSSMAKLKRADLGRRGERQAGDDGVGGQHLLRRCRGCSRW